MGRRPCCAKVGLNRGSWSASEDMILTNYVLAHGEGKWRDLPRRAGLQRCGKSCRLRWLNYLRPDIKRGNITNEEEDLIIRLHNLLGNRWSLIAGRLPGRTDNEIKNYWNTNLSKRLNGVNTNSGGPSSRRQTTGTKPANIKKKATVEYSRRLRTTTTTTTSSIPQKQSVNVTRTKAVRCTGIYPLENVVDVQLQNTRGSTSKTDPTDSTHLPVPTPTGNDDADDYYYDDDDDPLGLFKGMDVDEFMSEIQLGSDLLQECCAGDATTANSSDQIDQGGNGDGADVVSPAFDCSLLHFDDEIPEEYWKDCLQPKVDGDDDNDDDDDFEALISFLDQ